MIKIQSVSFIVDSSNIFDYNQPYYYPTFLIALPFSSVELDASLS